MYFNFMAKIVVTNKFVTKSDTSALADPRYILKKDRIAPIKFAKIDFISFNSLYGIMYISLCHFYVILTHSHTI